MTKKLLTISIFISALLLTFKVGFAADIQYVYTTQTELTKGVTLTNYDIFMSDRRWNKAYVATADLNYPHLSLEVISNKNGTSYLSNVLDMAKSVDSTVAINSDFFNWGTSSGRGSPIGAVYFDKQMYSSPATDSGMYTIMQDMSRNVFAELVDYKIILTAPNGEQKQIAGKNKASDLSQIMMYDIGYDEYSLGSTETQYEFVVRDDTVSEIRFSSEPLKMEENMYVLAGLSDHDTFLLENFKVGDKVKIDEISNIDFSDLKLAAGAGAKLLEDGTIVKNFSHTINGTNPRTAFGISKNKRTVYFVVVDGRSNNSGGMSMSELAAFMEYIGAYNALNLDGGGSSTFVTKDLKTSSQQLINTPSDTSMRKVATSLAVVSSVKKPSTLYHLKLTADSENVFKNSHIKLSVEGFDEYYFPVSINTKNISYSVSGVEGYFEDNAFFPTSSGTATITARMSSGANANISLRVLDTPYKIEHQENNISLNVGESKDFLMFARDKDGYMAPVYLCDMKVNFSQNIARVKNNAIFADKEGSALMSAKFGDAIIYVSVQVGKNQNIITPPPDKTVLDSLDKTGTALPDDVLTRFAVFGALRESDTLFNNIVMKKSLSKINQSASTAFLLSTHATENVAPNITIPVQTCYPFTSFTKNGDKYIVLDAEDNFMSAKEWTWFLNELKTLNCKNLFVFMQTDAVFVNDKETKLLKDVLSELAQRNTNVFVFCTGNDNIVEKENGVRYIKTPGFSDDIKTNGFVTLSSKLQYILVDIDKNGAVSYRFMPIY